MPNIIHYRKKCIGCGICYEMQPDYWRMSKKDGKATLVKALGKKDVYVLSITSSERIRAHEVALVCPVKIIKIQ
ncbi:MAG: ferredoxin [Ferruginibacter sp.]